MKAAITLILLTLSTTMRADVVEDSRFTRKHDKDHPHDFSPAFADRAAWERRAAQLRQQVQVALGLYPMPLKTPLAPVIHGLIERDDYTVEKVFFASLPGHYVSGNLYRPKGRRGKLAGVLFPHGHWLDGRFNWRSDEGIDKEIASKAESSRDAARSPLQANCVALARMGCVVFHYDAVGSADSQKIPHREGFLDAEALLRLQSFAGLQTWNSVRALDFVLSLPEIDPARIAVTGSSGGGTQAFLLDAVDDRVAVVFPMVMVSMNMQGGCVCENAPLLRVGTNNVEIASLFAPRPQGMAAANDWTKDFLTRGLPEMKSIWRLYDAEDQVDGHHVDFGHNHNLHSRKLQYAFLNEHLKLSLTEPIEEKPFEPLKQKDLSVYDAEHPLPADATDAAGVRKWMTRTSDEQLAAMTPAARDQMRRTALAAMVCDELPAPAEIESDPPLQSAAGEWNGFVSRKGAGERVPCKAIFPQKWNGRVWVCLAPVPDGIIKTLDKGWAIISIEPFMSERFKPTKPKSSTAATRSGPNPPYAAYALGYERSVIANRVHDLLSAIALARTVPGMKSVHMFGEGPSGIAAALAGAIAGDSIEGGNLGYDGWDFDNITDDADPMLLPGALKYGGIEKFGGLIRQKY